MYATYVHTYVLEYIGYDDWPTPKLSPISIQHLARNYQFFALPMMLIFLIALYNLICIHFIKEEWSIILHS